MGVDVKEIVAGIRVKSDVSQLKPVTVKTLPHPGFQPICTNSYSTYGSGRWGINQIETVFENRFQHLRNALYGTSFRNSRDTAMISLVVCHFKVLAASTDLRASQYTILL